MLIISGLIIVGLGYGTLHFVGITEENRHLFLLMVLAWGIQGASEELLVRGYMFQELREKASVSLALMLSSSYFAILHLGNQGITIISFINIILAGLFFALYYWQQGDIWGACGFHSAWNFTQGNLLGLPVSGLSLGGGSIMHLQFKAGNEFITGGVFGVEGSSICTAILLIGIGVLYLLLYKQGEIGNIKNIR
ncbi:CPBP family intramembrane glutamic endopeptidase [Sporanaerobium hydrogeniformans]|uniref:CPBP family intramembrane glutamic endopeptidase n=1 Tax=Sporanaerobium hydrogeniformans TaxID=3072179 RepID=UPI0015D4E2EB|nr:CPBP family intramembrane glutamic endopeptidase [Sporanaerobium hydrogeniformans]